MFEVYRCKLFNSSVPALSLAAAFDPSIWTRSTPNWPELVTFRKILHENRGKIPKSAYRMQLNVRDVSRWLLCHPKPNPDGQGLLMRAENLRVFLTPIFTLKTLE